MIQIDIRPVWRFRAGEEREFDFQLIAILAEVDTSSKLTQGAERAGISYRHAWNLIQGWEAFFGAPLVVKERGRGTRLTPLGRALLSAGRRAQARLEPELGNLAAEFARTLNQSLTASTPSLVMHASHDFAIAALREMSAASRVAIELQYKGSFEALASLRRGECEVAGFHVPEGGLGSLMARRYAEYLPMERYALFSFVMRTQGLMVHAGNPLSIGSVTDLCRPGVRMVNRQRGSGTRALLEFLISSEGLDRARMSGYDTEETTHGAVAAMVAGHQADVGFGVEAAAAEYRLEFLPVCRERYLLACRKSESDTPEMRHLLGSLRGEAFRKLIDAMPGYSAAGAGETVESLEPASVPR
jgi:molybdate transport repressor ModE-like protein